MKKEKILSIKSEKKSNKPKKINKRKKGKNQLLQEEDFQLEQNDSFSEIFDSQENSINQSFDEQNPFTNPSDQQNYEYYDEESEKQDEQDIENQADLDFNESQQKVKKKHSSSRLLSSNEQLSGNFSQEKQQKIQDLQAQRLEKYLKKTSNDQKNNQKIKIEENETSIVIKQFQTVNEFQQTLQSKNKSSYATKPKIDSDDTKSIKSRNDSQKDSEFLNYLVQIMNGTIPSQELQNRKKQDEKRQKLQDKIKQLQRRKIQQKIKKQFDSRTESDIKVLSTNMDSLCNKEEIESFRIDQSQDILKQKSKFEDHDHPIEKQNKRKKRTRVTTDMLKQLSKQFQIMAKQQSGVMPPGNSKITFKDIGSMFKLGRSSVMKMYADYCKDPTMKSRFDNKQPMSHNKTMMELTKRRITFVQRLIRKDCTLSQREIAAQMNLHEDLKCKRKRAPGQTIEEYMRDPYHPIAYKAVSRLMKLGNFTRKKVTLIPKNRNSQRTIQQRYYFCKVLNQLVADDHNKLYYLDECRFNLFTSRNWGWAPRGQLATKVRHNSKGKDVMLLAIIGKEGLIGYEVSDSYNRGSFTIAIQKMILSIIPEVVPQGQKIYLILDNCPIHNKQCLKHMESKMPLTVLYLPPYSPMLNPIESWFGQLKRIVKSKVYKTRQAMRAEIIKVLETFRNKSMDNYYRGINKYIALGLQKQLYRGNNKF